MLQLKAAYIDNIIKVMLLRCSFFVRFANGNTQGDLSHISLAMPEAELTSKVAIGSVAYTASYRSASIIMCTV